jgi:ketosteroid isomerase-like protein
VAEAEQLESLYGGLAAWNRGDYEAALSYSHPDVVWRVEPFFPDMESVYTGHDEMRRFFQTFNEAWEENSLEVSRVVDQRPGQIYVEIRFRARAREGLVVESDFHQIYRYGDDDLLREFHGFADEADARREAGLDDG